MNTRTPNEKDRPLDQLLEATIKIWQPYTSQPLTKEDARSIIKNVVGFFTLLWDWHEATSDDDAEQAA